MLTPNDRIMFTRAEDARLTFATPDAGDAAPLNSIGTLKGYAITWNALSDDRGGFKVRLAPNSAKFAANTFALNHHSFNGGPLADTASKTLRILPADSYGQPVEIDLPDTQNGRDVLALVKSGRMRGMSFAMTQRPAPPHAEFIMEGGQKVLFVKSFLADEVSVLAVPSFSGTSIQEKKSGNEGEISRARLKLELYRQDIYRP